MGTSGTLRKLLRLILVVGGWTASFYKRKTSKSFYNQLVKCTPSRQEVFVSLLNNTLTVWHLRIVKFMQTHTS